MYGKLLLKLVMTFSMKNITGYYYYSNDISITSYQCKFEYS